MYTLVAAAAIAACLSGPAQSCNHSNCTPFAPNVHNRLLATLPPEDASRVYTPGSSDYSARLWVAEDAKDIRARRATHENPGKLAYGAADAGCDHVLVKVGPQVVRLSPWQQVEGEGWSNFERARSQWLAERGYTGGVRTFVNPARLRAMQQQGADCNACTAADRAEQPQPSATIRLRNPDQTPGVIKKVDAGVAGGIRIIAGNQPVHISWPMTARAEVVERCAARGWTESKEEKTQVADAGK
ncbi:MAG: hypothetical protein IPJ41_12175 [Phycisphaerales bacterium]|nr:hypothetical protein [Phycisphaerales bacterium]